MLNALEEGLAGEISEDCLFLDIQVPGKAIRNPDEQALPVVVWIFGGAFTFGSKNVFGGLKGGMPFLPLYEGTGVLRQSHGDIIFVSINYRVCRLFFLVFDASTDSSLPLVGCVGLASWKHDGKERNFKSWSLGSARSTPMGTGLYLFAWRRQDAG